MNNTNNLDNFFSYISKAVIVIPIFIFVISLFFKFGQLPAGRQVNQTPTEVQTPKLAVSTTNNSFKFDLKGPIVCDNLFIQDKKVLLKNKLINYLLNGDCLYIWQGDKLNGEKKCGLTNYVNLADNYFGALNIDDLVNNNLVKDYIKDKQIDLMDIIKSCKRGAIKDDSIFIVPEKVLFINKK